VQSNRGQGLAEQREHWDAIHYGRFEEEPAILPPRESLQFCIGVNDRTFIGGDGVRSEFQSRAQMIDGGVTVLYVQRSCLEQDIGLRGTQPGVHVGELVGRGPQVSVQRADTNLGHPRILSFLDGVLVFGIWMCEFVQTRRIEAFCICPPAQPPRSDTGDMPRNALGTQIGVAIRQQARERPVDVAKSQEAQIESSDGGLA